MVERIVDCFWFLAKDVVHEDCDCWKYRLICGEGDFVVHLLPQLWKYCHCYYHCYSHWNNRWRDVHRLVHVVVVVVLLVPWTICFHCLMLDLRRSMDPFASFLLRILTNEKWRN